MLVTENLTKDRAFGPSIGGLLRVLTRILFVAGVALIPVYTSSPGGLQPAHYLLIGFILFSFMRTPLLRIRRVEFASLLFAASVWVLELGHAIFEQRSLYSYVAMTTTYGVLLFIATVRFSQDRHFYLLLKYGLGLAVGVSIASLIIAEANIISHERATGFFNNPNQLGYFSVLTLAMFLVLAFGRHCDEKTAILAVCACIALAMLSLSKAAILSVVWIPVVLVPLWLFRNPKSQNSLIFAATAALLLLNLAMIILLTQPDFPSSINMRDVPAIERLLNFRRENDSSLSARGYFVMSSAGPLEIFVGLSSHGVRVTHGAEVHSTLFSIMSQHGVVGSILFLLLLYACFKRGCHVVGIQRCMIVFAPVMLYGLTHNGGRFVLFWIFLGVMASLRQPAASSNRPLINS